MPTHLCTVCGDTFYTRVGLAEHVRIGTHSRYTRRWVTGFFSPVALPVLQEVGRRIAAQNNARRRRCNECGHTTTPGPLALHQNASGHTGWTDVEP